MPKDARLGWRRNPNITALRVIIGAAEIRSKHRGKASNHPLSANPKISSKPFSYPMNDPISANSSSAHHIVSVSSAHSVDERSGQVLSSQEQIKQQPLDADIDADTIQLKNALGIYPIANSFFDALGMTYLPASNRVYDLSDGTNIEPYDDTCSSIFAGYISFLFENHDLSNRDLQKEKVFHVFKQQLAWFAHNDYININEEYMALKDCSTYLNMKVDMEEVDIEVDIEMDMEEFLYLSRSNFIEPLVIHLNLEIKSLLKNAISILNFSYRNTHYSLAEKSCLEVEAILKNIKKIIGTAGKEIMARKKLLYGIIKEIILLSIKIPLINLFILVASFVGLIVNNCVIILFLPAIAVEPFVKNTHAFIRYSVLIFPAVTLMIFLMIKLKFTERQLNFIKLLSNIPKTWRKNSEVPKFLIVFKKLEIKLEIIKEFCLRMRKTLDMMNAVMKNEAHLRTIYRELSSLELNDEPLPIEDIIKNHQSEKEKRIKYTTKFLVRINYNIRDLKKSHIEAIV